MPVGPVRVREIVVTEDDAREIIEAFSIALNTLSLEALRNLYLFPKNRHALAISLDAELRPFLGFTSGYNFPGDRAYLLGRIRIMDEVSEILSGLDREQRGGRVFLSEYSASKVIDGGIHTLCTYEWPGEGPHSMGRRLYDARLGSQA